MPDKPTVHMGCFGSPLRAGRENACYQADRLERLSRFSLTLLDAYRRRLVQQERVNREIWNGKQWLEAEYFKWQRIAADQEKLLHERAEYIKQLEEVRAWLLGQVEHYRAELDRLSSKHTAGEST